MSWGTNRGTGHLPSGNTSNYLGCPVPRHLIILRTTRNTSEEVEPFPLDGLCIPMIVVSLQEFIRGHPIPEHTYLASSQFIDLQGLTHLFRSFGLIAHISYHSQKHSHSHHYLSIPFSLSQFLFIQSALEIILAYKPPFWAILLNWLNDYPTFKTHLPSVSLSLIINKFWQGIRSLLRHQLSQSMPEILPV